MTGINAFFWLLIIAHMLGDFYFQTDRLVANKKEKLRYQLIHGAIYALPVLFVMTFYASCLWCAGAFLVIAISHFFIDFIKIKAVKKYKNSDISIFFIDQFLHIAIIYIITLTYAVRGAITLNPFGTLIYESYVSLNTGISANALIKAVCAFALILRPANVIIRVLKPQISLQNNSFFKNDPGQAYNSLGGGKASGDSRELIKSGSMIGNLERILMLVLLMYGQYTAIAFVLTAKSIARYNKISENPAFAEYYLIGTLTSVVIAVLASLIAK